MATAEKNTRQNKDTLSPGTVLFGYRVLKRVGEGGWAYVYKAQHPKLPKVVALKQLKPELVRDERNLRRFLREAHIVSQIEHPNVVTIHDLLYDKETEWHYIVTEFAEKGNLEDRLKEFPTGLPVDEVLHMALGICSGLEAAHRKGVVHRDVKPSNILLFDAGEKWYMPKLSDFGIAKAPPGEGEEASKDSGIYGSLPYMSPEQLDEDIEVDNRSDLYSLGITLYELITGQVPFPLTGDIQDIFWAHIYMSPKPPRDIRPDIPEALETIVLRALQKKPQERYQSAAGMREALRAIVDASAREVRRRKFKALLEQGQAHLRDEKWEEAIEVLGQADSLEPGNELVLEGLQKAREQQQLKRLYELGVQYMEERKWREARDRLAEIVFIDPDYEGGEARILLDRAREELKRRQKQDDLMAQYKKGMGHFRKHQWAPAIEELEQVVADDPEFEDAAERLEKARRYVQADGLYEQARRQITRGDWEEAVELLEEVESLNPPHFDVTQELQYARNKLEELRIEQQLGVWYERGMTYLAAGDLEQAKVHFERIHQRQPDYRDVEEQLRKIEDKLYVNQLLERAYEHEAAGEWEQAAKACTEVLAIDSFNREASRCLDRVQTRAEHEERHIIQRFDWRRSLAVAFAIGTPFSIFIALLAKNLFSLDYARFAFLIASLLLALVSFVILTQWIRAQGVKTKDDQQTEQ